ncbi:50S ribosomal protein L19 [Candidatus Gracilibacteria bacterium]|nr:50S ribosomal protein L19 [Candidatus Gracilibacteria bacterium]
MSQLIQDFTKKCCKDSVPDLRPGYQVRVHQKIQEGNKTRIQVFEGMVVRVNSGHGVSDSFTVRKISEGIGVEKVFLIHSPNITKIEVQRAHKVRRSKLNFLRDLSGKALRLKEIPFKLREKLFEKPAGMKKDDLVSEGLVEEVVEEIVEESPVKEEFKEEVAVEEEKKEEEQK